eukprot:1152529-Pelagomonas_calceolata.AAC.1
MNSVHWLVRLMGILACTTVLENKYQSKRIQDSFSQTLPPHIHKAFQEWAHATQEKMASSLDLGI